MRNNVSKNRKERENKSVSRAGSRMREEVDLQVEASFVIMGQNGFAKKRQVGKDKIREKKKEGERQEIKDLDDIVS